MATHAPSLDLSGQFEQDPTDSGYATGSRGKSELYKTETIYSAFETSNLLPVQDKYFIADLAADLFKTVKPCASERANLERISKQLPDLLRSFALKIGYKAQPGMHRDVSYFIHKYRR